MNAECDQANFFRKGANDAPGARLLILGRPLERHRPQFYSISSVIILARRSRF